MGWDPRREHKKKEGDHRATRVRRPQSALDEHNTHAKSTADGESAPSADRGRTKTSGHRTDKRTAQSVTIRRDIKREREWQSVGREGMAEKAQLRRARVRVSEWFRDQITQSTTTTAHKRK